MDGKYEVDTMHLKDLELRSIEKYEKYGAKAIFGEDKKLICIYVASLDENVPIMPINLEWAHAKWVWKVSLITSITVGPHLVHLHWTVSNFAHIAAR